MLSLKPLLEASNNILEVRLLQSAEELALYKEFILKHYLQKDPRNITHRFGIFRVADGIMIGLVAYGPPTDTGLLRNIVDFNRQQLFNSGEIWELKRLWALDDDKVHNAESQAISLANTEIANLRKETKAIVTYADTKIHKGTVYTASNAIEISMPGSKLRRFFYPVGNPTTRKISRKKLEWYKENFNQVKASNKPLTEVAETKVNDYGCLMAQLNKLKNWHKVLSIIEQDDVYDDEEHQYGMEKEPHVTVLYGFKKSVSDKDVKTVTEKAIKEPISIEVLGISHFDGAEFDVVKFTVESEALRKLHKIFQKFPHVDTFKDYTPHITIAYVKKGLGKKYDQTLKKKVVLTTNLMKYTYPDGKYMVWELKIS